MTFFKQGKTWLVAALAAGLLHALSGRAQNTIHVPADVPSIQAAIDASRSGDTVLVSPGTYNENINFKGKAITVTSRAQSFAQAVSTIINAIGDGAGVTFNTGETTLATLNGFTIQNGHTNSADCSQGGGIYVTGASPTISNNIIANNENYGLYIEDQSGPLILGNDVKFNHPTTVDVTGCPSVSGVSGAGTGIVLMNVGSPQIIGNTIEENVNFTLTLEGSGSQGAGILLINGEEFLLRDNIIRNNTAATNSAIAVLQPKKFTMVQNLIYGNPDALNPLGGEPQVDITGSSDFAIRPVLTETNNTIYGGGEELIYFFSASTIENNLFANPTAATGSINFSGGLLCDPDAVESRFTVQNNDIFTLGVPSPDACNFPGNNINVDPRLRDPANGDFHEQLASSTVAAGNLSAPAIPAADLDNKARIVCNTIDMGAYQLRPHPPVALTSSANPAPGGSSLTFTAQLTGNCNTPTGTVTFYDGSNAIGAAALSQSGTAILTTSLLVVGQHNITAQYPGDFNFDQSSSSILVETITGDPTVTSLMVAPNPTGAFSPIALSATVKSPYGTPTGSVAFSAGESQLAIASLDGNGLATITISTLGAGKYSIVASYTADTRFQPSSSGVVEEVVIGANSTTSLSSSVNPAEVTQTIMFTAVVRAAQGSATPSGQVTFTDGASVLGNAAVNNSGVAGLAVSTLSFGNHKITASYGGSANFNPSSATISEAVTLIGTSVGLTASPNPANFGQAVTLSATVTATIAGMIPTGAIEFYDGRTAIGSAILDTNGIATLGTSSLGVGVHSITAVLAGNSSFAGSSSHVVNEVVQAYDFNLALSRTNVSIPSGDYTNLTVAISPVGGFNGSVTLSCNGVPDHTQCVFPQGDTVSLSGETKTVKLSINTSDVYGNGKLISRSSRPRDGAGGREALAILLVPALTFLGLRGRSRNVLRILKTACLAVAVLGIGICLQSCSGKQPGKTPPGVYPVTVVGTSVSGPALMHSVSEGLTITP